MNNQLPWVLAAVLGATACGDPQEKHIWKDQTDMIDRAADVEDLLMEKSRQQDRLSGQNR